MLVLVCGVAWGIDPIVQRQARIPLNLVWFVLFVFFMFVRFTYIATATNPFECPDQLLRFVFNVTRSDRQTSFEQSDRAAQSGKFAREIARIVQAKPHVEHDSDPWGECVGFVV